VRENCTRGPQSSRSFRSFPPPYSTPLPLLNNPTPEQAFLSKNYDENARRADRDSRGIFCTPTDASAPPAAGLVGPLDSSFDGGDGGLRHGRRLGSLGLGRRADVAYSRERGELDAARGAAELLQEPSKFQGPRGEPRNLGGEPWCGSWEAAADRAEDFGQWCWC
jgi:hypothetical protein